MSILFRQNMHASQNRSLRNFWHGLLLQLHRTDELPQGIYVSLLKARSSKRVQVIRQVSGTGLSQQQLVGEDT